MVKHTTNDSKKKWSPSTNYPAIEALVESEDFSEVNKAFEKAYRELETLAQKKKGLKKGREAEKGMVAIERVIALFKELVSIKYQMQKGIEKTKRL